ncbi:hypothetical protein BDZ89DRAFT_683648 [Hymenopellis radicata]|nr:hypothetical protein BDZ89DRAFT_683648 [Hymenopellis radicata]
MGLTWNTMNEIFITHGTSLEAEFSFSCVGQCVSRGSAVIVVRVLAVFLADFILILRCWVLYGGDFRIVAAPILCLITETSVFYSIPSKLVRLISFFIVSACYVLFYFATAGQEVDASRAVWTLVYYSMTMVTNSLCTFLLLFRNMSVRGIGAIFKTSRGIIEVFVESAAMS